jgi:anti-sigma factor RsiW
MLSAYVDDDLSHADRRRADEHLATCEACRSALHGMHALVTSLHRFSARPPAKSLVDFRRRLAAEHPGEPVPLHQTIAHTRRLLVGALQWVSLEEERRRVAAMLARLSNLCP